MALKEPDMNNPQRQLGVELQQTFLSSEGAEYYSISRPFRAKDLSDDIPPAGAGGYSNNATSWLKFVKTIPVQQTNSPPVV